jgi:mono/diheme cytochrome c family protein
MRRTALLLLFAAFVFAAGSTAAGCGGEEEASPTPDTFTDTTTTETTETTETTQTETTPPGDPAAGKEIFVAQCGTCHTLADAGTSGTIGPNLDESQPDFELVVDRVTNGRGVMPAFEDQLSEQQIVDVSTYVSQTAGS